MGNERKLVLEYDGWGSKDDPLMSVSGGATVAPLNFL